MFDWGQCVKIRHLQIVDVFADLVLHRIIPIEVALNRLIPGRDKERNVKAHQI